MIQAEALVMKTIQWESKSSICKIGAGELNLGQMVFSKYHWKNVVPQVPNLIMKYELESEEGKIKYWYLVSTLSSLEALC